MVPTIRCPTCQFEIPLSDPPLGYPITCPQCQNHFLTEPHLLAAAEVIPEVVPVLQPPHPGFWWAVLWCVGIVLLISLLPGVLGGILLVILSPQALRSGQLGDTQALYQSTNYAYAMLAAMLVSQVLSVACALFVIRLIVGRDWRRLLAFRLPTVSHLSLAVIGLPGMILLTIGVDALARKVLPSFVDLEQVMAMFGKWPWPLGVLIIGLGPGIGEELWFRGFLGRGLLSRYGVLAGTLLTSLLFGLVHLEPRQVVYAGFMGILLHLSYLASRSLLVPMLLHVANNSLSILALHSPALAAIDLPAEQIPWTVYGAALVLVAAVGWAFYRSRSLLVDGPETAAVWRPAFPGVECPPLKAASQLQARTPGLLGWVLVLGGVALFAGAIGPAVVEAMRDLPDR